MAHAADPRRPSYFSKGGAFLGEVTRGHGASGIMSDQTIEIAGLTDVGQRRDHNEDAWTVFSTGPEQERLVCVVADGMGGHLAGEVASARAVETIERELGEHAADEPATALRAALERANAVIWDEGQRDRDKSGMGSTVVCAVIEGDRILVANVGDSRAYLVSNGQARQITHDHTWVAEQLVAGDIRPEDVVEHPYRHVLTRSLGAENAVEVELYEPFEPEAGDVLILCSDGLTDHVASEEIGAIVAETPAAETAARRLIDLANQRGGHDNITVVVARVRSE
jgi:serine/threonine protein phosphatase PrpC